MTIPVLSPSVATMPYCKAIPSLPPPFPRRSHPAKHGDGFDAPANLIAQRFRAPEGGYIPNPYGRDLGLGYRVRTLPQGFLSPTRGTERVVKTIEDRWGLLTIHILIILLILPRSNMIHPFLIIEIPFYGLFDALLKLQ